MRFKLTFIGAVAWTQSLGDKLQTKRLVCFICRNSYLSIFCNSWELNLILKGSFQKVPTALREFSFSRLTVRTIVKVYAYRLCESQLGVNCVPCFLHLSFHLHYAWRSDYACETLSGSHIRRWLWAASITSGSPIFLRNDSRFHDDLRVGPLTYVQAQV